MYFTANLPAVAFKKLLLLLLFPVGKIIISLNFTVLLAWLILTVSVFTLMLWTLAGHGEPQIAQDHERL